MELKRTPVVEFSDDSKWLCDLAFLVDYKYLSELDLKLQNFSQLLSFMLSNVESFDAKLKHWQVELEKGNTVHFPTPQQKPVIIFEYRGEHAKLLQAFGGSLQDMESKQN